MICRDFNYPEIDWEDESVGENSEPLAFFVSKIQASFLHQHISELTRYRFGEEPSLLDLVLTNEEGMVRNLEYQSGQGNSDHLSFIFGLVCQGEKNKETGTQPDFFKTDFVSVRNVLRNINCEDKYVPKHSMRNLHEQ